VSKNKQDRLDKLDELVLEEMIKILEGESEKEMSDLSTAVQYLKANNKTEDKQRSGNSQDDKIKEAERRRQERKNKEQGS